MIYLLSDPTFAYGLATFSVLIAVARTVYKERNLNEQSQFYHDKVAAASDEIRRLNRLLRERDERINDGKAANRNQSQIMQEQAKDLHAKYRHLRSLMSQLEKAHARLDRVQNILDNGTCHECPPADQKES